jgi:hypothetical protein
LYRSDDIWARNSNDGISNQEHQNPIGNAVNYVYVRVRNRGCGTAASGQVKLYWAKASSGLGWPSPWDGSVTSPALMGNFIDAKPTGSISASGYTILEYEWTAPNPADYSSFGADKAHFCLLSRIETSPTAPFGMTSPETSNLGANVKNNNNIVWKNITVAEPDAGGRAGKALIGNFSKESKLYRVLFESTKGEPNIFEHGTVRATLSERLYQVWEAGGFKGEGIERSDRQLEIILLKDGAFLDNLKLDKNQFAVVTVLFQPNQKTTSGGRYVFQLEMTQNQLDGNVFVGAQSFKFRVGN